MISVDRVNTYLWKLSSLCCLNFVGLTPKPLSIPFWFYDYYLADLEQSFPVLPVFKAGSPIHISEHSLLERPHLCSPLSCTFVQLTYAVMQKSSQTSMILG